MEIVHCFLACIEKKSFLCPSKRSDSVTVRTWFLRFASILLQTSRVLFSSFICHHVLVPALCFQLLCPSACNINSKSIAIYRRNSVDGTSCEPKFQKIPNNRWSCLILQQYLWDRTPKILTLAPNLVTISFQYEMPVTIWIICWKR